MLRRFRGNPQDACPSTSSHASQKVLAFPQAYPPSLSPAATIRTSSPVSRLTMLLASGRRWLPIMHAYESGTPAYFGRPVNLIRALHDVTWWILRRRNPGSGEVEKT